MTFRWFLLVMSVASIAAWIAWVFVLHTIDPVRTNIIGFVLFYLTLFISILGTNTLFGTFIRLWVRPTDIPFRQTVRAFRQGILLSFLLIGSLWLLSSNLLRWWTIFLFVLIVSLIELFLVTRQKRKTGFEH